MTSTYALLIFGAIVIGLEILVMIRRGKGWGTTSSRLVGLTLVAVLTVFVFLARNPEDDVAPVFAIIGTIAGYLVGKSDGTAAEG